MRIRSSSRQHACRSSIGLHISMLFCGRVTIVSTCFASSDHAIGPMGEIFSSLERGPKIQVNVLDE